jgi:hypothetical protein
MLISKLSDVGTDGLVCTNFPHLRSEFLSMADVVRRRELEEGGVQNLEKLGLPFWEVATLCTFVWLFLPNPGQYVYLPQQALL